MDSRNDPPKSASLIAHLTFIHYHDLNMVCVTYRSIVTGILGCTVALLGAGCMNAGGGETSVRPFGSFFRLLLQAISFLCSVGMHSLASSTHVFCM